MNDTPQGDGNFHFIHSLYCFIYLIRMNDTPQGDGNCIYINIYIFTKY